MRVAHGTIKDQLLQVPQTDENGEYRCLETFRHTCLPSGPALALLAAHEYGFFPGSFRILFRYSANAYMDKTDVLSKPVNEIIEVKKGKSKKKPRAYPIASTGTRVRAQGWPGTGSPSAATRLN